MTDKKTGTVAMFVTCLVDLMRPSVGWATVKLLEDQGFAVEVPEAQTCCGQPAYNSGDRATAIDIARNTISALQGYDYVVVPSGSCGGMISHHYPELFKDDDDFGPKARDLARRTFELTTFLSDVVKNPVIDAASDKSATYHDSCSSLREMKIKNQPRALMSQVDGLEVREMEGTEECCGFGGTFCVKYPDISGKMVSSKLDKALATGADMLVAGDLGCLMNIAGKAKREGQTLEVRHIAEVLAGDTDTPAIGEPS